MTGIDTLILPLFLSSVLVFFASFILHMVLPWHKSDYPQVPDEDRVMDALRQFNLAPGDYFMPRPANQADMKSPGFLEKMKKGPVAVMTIRPSGPPSMGKPLAWWFIYCVIVGFFAAYIAGRALPPGAPYLQVFRFVGASAFLGYTLALWQTVIWYGRSSMTTTKSTIDGLIYALLTAGTFGWLWPHS
jgi:hypothetical protein